MFGLVSTQTAKKKQNQISVNSYNATDMMRGLLCIHLCNFRKLVTLKIVLFVKKILDLFMYNRI